MRFDSYMALYPKKTTAFNYFILCIYCCWFACYIADESIAAKPPAVTLTVQCSVQ